MVVRLPVPSPPQNEELHWLIRPTDEVDLSGLSWYIDGSLIDPRTPFQRLGTGITGILHGTPAALAWAIPPPWIDSIPGAEAWALFTVLRMCHTLPAVTTDCLGNRRTLLEGKEAATRADRPLARVWNAIFSCCEDALISQLDAMLTWCPAHTSWATVGSKLRSDQRPLTVLDWRANALADAAAKLAANSARAPRAVRDRYRQLIAAHQYGAAIAGVACRAANHHCTHTVDREGNVRVAILRDSVGRPEGTTQKSAELREISYPTKTAEQILPPCPLESSIPADFPRAQGALQLHQASLLTHPANLPQPVSQTSERSSTPRIGIRAQRKAPVSTASRSARLFGLERHAAVQAAALANSIARCRTPPSARLNGDEVQRRVRLLTSSAQRATLSCSRSSSPCHSIAAFSYQPLSQPTCVTMAQPHEAARHSSCPPPRRSSAKKVANLPATAAGRPSSCITPAMYRLMHG